MNPRLNRLNQPNRQHQRFSWQTPPVTPPEEAQNHRQPQQQAQQQSHQRQQPAQLDTDLATRNPRAFSYAQTPAEHLAFQYIPSPSDVPPVPQLPLPQAPLAQGPPTPIDPRPQSIYNPQISPQAQQQQPQPVYPTLAYQHTQHQTRPQSLSPISPHDPRSAPLYSPVSPIANTPPPQQAQPTRPLTINTKVGFQTMPPIPATPASYTHPSSPPPKTPITPMTPASIKKTDPSDYLNPASPHTPRSYAHEPYSPHNLPSNTKVHNAVFSPDSAHGPNGLDFSLHQPGQIAHPNMDLSTSGTTREWKHSLCSCSPSPLSDCLTGLLCPCILYGRTAYRLHQKSAKADPTDLLSYKTPNGHCMLMSISCGFWWLYPLVQRTRLRHMYKLQGSLPGDCVRGLCCCCCVAVQNEREVREREEASRRWAGPASTEVYKRAETMSYTPQR